MFRPSKMRFILKKKKKKKKKKKNNNNNKRSRYKRVLTPSVLGP